MTNSPGPSGGDLNANTLCGGGAKKGSPVEAVGLTQANTGGEARLGWSSEAMRAERNVDFLAVQRPVVEGSDLVDERIREIAVLTEMIWERDRLIANLERRTDWLTRVLQLALTGLSRGSGRFISGSVFKRRLLKKLASRNIFDGAAYLAANPDVAVEGVEPLLHYAMHGLAEGRTAGLMNGDRS